MHKKLAVFCTVTALLLSVPSHAKTILNADGSQPMVHWAVLKSTPGTMSVMLELGAKHVAPYTDKEPGTYALYGGVDKTNPDLLRLLEIYRDKDAYQEHRSSNGFKTYLQEREPILAQLHIMEADSFLLETKDSGTGTIVRMARLKIDSQQLEPYKNALREEILTSVEIEPGVLALLATTEKANPNIFHLLEIYSDDEAYRQHIKSPHFQKYNSTVQNMILEKNLIENQPVMLTLTGKPF